ncbi:MAG TPA: pantetheine-phosphate adenylyltransferase [Solirubrobacterales bacterium]|nr:pantetheine-phosphate adenylyltransferase [Solirubrobacterales bacterium]
MSNNNYAGKIAVCPGSYDPITNGHLDIIRRGARVFERLVVGVVNASVRKSQPLFEADERIELIRESVKDLPNVEIQKFDILLVDFARQVGASVILKGLRAISDFEYEFEMNQLNRTMAPELESVYMMSSPMYSFISSSGIKEMVRFGGNVSEMVPPHVAIRLTEALAQQSDHPGQ